VDEDPHVRLALRHRRLIEGCDDLIDELLDCRFWTAEGDDPFGARTIGDGYSGWILATTARDDGAALSNDGSGVLAGDEESDFDVAAAPVALHGAAVLGGDLGVVVVVVRHGGYFFILY